MADRPAQVPVEQCNPKTDKSSTPSDPPIYRPLYCTLTRRQCTLMAGVQTRMHAQASGSRRQAGSVPSLYHACLPYIFDIMVLILPCCCWLLLLICVVDNDISATGHAMPCHDCMGATPHMLLRLAVPIPHRDVGNAPCIESSNNTLSLCHCCLLSHKYHPYHPALAIGSLSGWLATALFALISR